MKVKYRIRENKCNDNITYSVEINVNDMGFITWTQALSTIEEARKYIEYKIQNTFNDPIKSSRIIEEKEVAIE